LGLVQELIVGGLWLSDGTPQARTWYQVKWFWTRGDKDKQGEKLEAVKGV